MYDSSKLQKRNSVSNKCPIWFSYKMGYIKWQFKHFCNTILPKKMMVYDRKKKSLLLEMFSLNNEHALQYDYKDWWIRSWEYNLLNANIYANISSGIYCIKYTNICHT